MARLEEIYEPDAQYELLELRQCFFDFFLQRNECLVQPREKRYTVHLLRVLSPATEKSQYQP